MTQRDWQRCEVCGGDGVVRKSELPEDEWDARYSGPEYLTSCALCRGSGEVPASWWWDDEGTLHKEKRA